jgi:SAM-dependent methyltransferase
MSTGDHQHGHEGSDMFEPESWDERYSGEDKVWSGNVNPQLVDVASRLTPGTALDVGCGEGGDVIWLARQGWRVTGVDISATAIDRARVAATAAAVDGAVEWVVHDLATWRGGDQTYDLVTASFLQSPVQLPRAEILQRAARLVAPGGHLLVVSHGAPPPWAAHGNDHDFPTPQREIDALRIVDNEWDVRIAETRSREWTAPDGRSGQLDDTVVLLHRKP